MVMLVDLFKEDYDVFNFGVSCFYLSCFVICSLSLSVFNLVSLRGLGEDHKAFNFGAGVADSNG